MEAAQQGALPLVPDRLCFPELYPDIYRYDGTSKGLYQRLHGWLTTPETRPGALNTEAWKWPAWREAYRSVLATDSAGVASDE